MYFALTDTMADIRDILSVSLRLISNSDSGVAIGAVLWREEIDVRSAEIEVRSADDVELKLSLRCIGCRGISCSLYSLCDRVGPEICGLVFFVYKECDALRRSFSLASSMLDDLLLALENKPNHLRVLRGELTLPPN